MRNLTCIVCPIGCSLEVEENIDQKTENNIISITGNRCAKGVNYAREELRSPKRVVTATCLINETQNKNLSLRRIPVKTSAPCPKEKIPDILNDIYKMKISLPVKTGDIIIADWNGEKIDVIATRSLIK